MSAELIFVLGPGGVGKTTTSAVLALEAAGRGQRVALITVDPARRLAQALGQERLPHRPQPVPNVPGLHAAMIDRGEAWDSVVERCMAQRDRATALHENRYFKSLVSEFPGSLEYVACDVIVGLVEDGDFDLVVVDTPPANDALAFLDAPARLGQVFDGEFLRLISSGGLVSRAARRGGGMIRKVLAKFIGEATMDELVTFLSLMQEVLAFMRARSRRMRALQCRLETQFILVGAADTAQLKDLATFKEQLTLRELGLHALVVNRLLPAPPPLDACQRVGESQGLKTWAESCHARAAREAEEQRERVEQRLHWASDLPVLTMPTLPAEPESLSDLAVLVPHLKSLADSGGFEVAP